MKVLLTFYITENVYGFGHRTNLIKKTINMVHTDELSIRKRTCHMHPGTTMKVELEGKEPYLIPSYLR